MLFRRRARGERGAAAVEFALILPIFLMLLFGIIDFGYMINRSSIINNASRDAVRIATFEEVTEAEVRAAADATLKGVPDATVTVGCKKRDAPTAACVFEASGPGDTAVVTVSYEHEMLTPVGIFFPGGFDLTRTAEMRRE